MVVRHTGRAEGFGGLKRGHGVVVDCCPVGAFYGAQASGDPGFAGGDGLPVAPAVGVLGHVLAVVLDFADVGLAVAGVCREVGLAFQAHSPGGAA